MTGKDYKAMAEILRELKPSEGAFLGGKDSQEYKTAFYSWRLTVKKFTDWLASENPRFDKILFQEACNKED